MSSHLPCHCWEVRREITRKGKKPRCVERTFSMSRHVALEGALQLGLTLTLKRCGQRAPPLPTHLSCFFLSISESICISTGLLCGRPSLLLWQHRGGGSLLLLCWPDLPPRAEADYMDLQAAVKDDFRPCAALDATVGLPNSGRAEGVWCWDEGENWLARNWRGERNKTKGVLVGFLFMYCKGD